MSELDTRGLFFNSWMVEQAQKSLPRNDLNVIVNDLNEFKNYYTEVQLDSDIYYLETNTRLFVYCKINDDIVAVIAFEKTPQNFSVTSTAKNIAYKGKPPYMSELYMAALTLAKPRSLLIYGDKTLTGDGFAVWSRLLSSGHTISVYNHSLPGQSLTKLNTIDDLKKYWGDDNQYRNYSFVLSENHQHWMDSVYEPFTVRRMRELANITLDEDYVVKVT